MRQCKLPVFPLLLGDGEVLRDWYIAAQGSDAATDLREGLGLLVLEPERPSKMCGRCVPPFESFVSDRREVPWRRGTGALGLEWAAATRVLRTVAGRDVVADAENTSMMPSQCLKVDPSATASFAMALHAEEERT